MLLIVLLVLGLAFVPANLAQRKGRNFWQWWIYAVVVLPVAWLHSRLIDPTEEAKSLTEKEVG